MHAFTSLVSLWLMVGMCLATYLRLLLRLRLATNLLRHIVHFDIFPD